MNDPENLSALFKEAVSMTSDYSFKTGGSSITLVGADYLTGNIETYNENDEYSYAGLGAVALLLDRNPTVFFDRCGDIKRADLRTNEYWKAIKEASYGYQSLKKK